MGMTDDLSVTREITDFLEKCPLDGFIEKLTNSELSSDDLFDIDKAISSIKLHESKLRTLRQRIEYQVRKHKLQEFRDRT